MTPFALLGELEKSGSHMEKQAFGAAMRTLGRLGHAARPGLRTAAQKARNVAGAAGYFGTQAAQQGRKVLPQVRNAFGALPSAGARVGREASRLRGMLPSSLRGAAHHAGLRPAWARRHPMLTAAGAGAITGLGAASYASSKKEENKSKGWMDNFPASNIGNVLTGFGQGIGNRLAAGAGAITGLGAASYASSKKEEDPEENKSKGWMDNFPASNIGNRLAGFGQGIGNRLEMGGKRIWP